MPAYANMDARLAGLLIGTPGQRRIESFAVQEILGIGFGLPAMGYPSEPNKCYGFHLDLGTITFDADLITANSILLTLQGVAQTPVVFATDHDTTMDLLVAAVVAAGYRATLPDSGGTNRVLAITTEGLTALATAVVTLGSTQAGATTAYTVDATTVFLGVTVFDQKEYNAVAKYDQYDKAGILAQGLITVSGGEALNANTPAYIRNADGLFGDSGFLTTARFRGDLSAAGLVDFEVNGQCVNQS